MSLQCFVAMWCVDLVAVYRYLYTPINIAEPVAEPVHVCFAVGHFLFVPRGATLAAVCLRGIMPGCIHRVSFLRSLTSKEESLLRLRAPTCLDLPTHGALSQFGFFLVSWDFATMQLRSLLIDVNATEKPPRRCQREWPGYRESMATDRDHIPPPLDKRVWTQDLLRELLGCDMTAEEGTRATPALRRRTQECGSTHDMWVTSGSG